jgi:uncharacterized RDD family membrane protein YckC
MERVGFGTRLLAAIVDGIILLIIIVALSAVLGTGMSFSTDPAANANMGLVAVLLMPLIVLAYYSLEIFKGQTPAKMLMKIIIRKEDGTPAPTNVLLTRWVIKNAGTLITLVGALTTLAILGTIGTLAGVVIFFGSFLALTAPKQTLHDKLAHTAVYKVA